MKIASTLSVIFLFMTIGLCFSQEKVSDLEHMSLAGPVREERRFYYENESWVCYQKMLFNSMGYMTENWSEISTVYPQDGEWYVSKVTYNPDNTVKEDRSYIYQNGESRLISKSIRNDTYSDGTNYVQYHSSGDIEFKIKNNRWIDVGNNARESVDFIKYDMNDNIIYRSVITESEDGQWVDVNRTKTDAPLVNELSYTDIVRKYYLYEDRALFTLGLDNEIIKRATMYPPYIDGQVSLSAMERMILMEMNGTASFESSMRAEFGYHGSANLRIDNDEYYINMNTPSSEEDGHHAHSSTMGVELIDKVGGNAIKVVLDENGEWVVSRSRYVIIRDDYGNWIEKYSVDEDGVISKRQKKEYDYYESE